MVRIRESVQVDNTKEENSLGSKLSTGSTATVFGNVVRIL